jgi:uncharacterized membrane protein (UPF0127 family)
VKSISFRDAEGREIARAAVADRFWPRFRGLMLRRDLPAGAGVFFPRCGSIHTFLMRFPIDILFLEDGRIARLISALPANRLRAHKHADVLELRSGQAAELGLAEGQQLVLEPAA